MSADGVTVYPMHTDDELDDICLSKGVKLHTTKRDKIHSLKKDEFFVIESNEIALSVNAVKKPRKYKEFVIETVGMQPSPNSFTPAGTPSVSARVLREMAGIII